MALVGGIFVGGAGSRFGGIAKGLLPAPGGAGTLLDRLVALVRAAGAEPVLVGERPEYGAVCLPVLRDEGVAGPLGGLLALYAYAGERRAIALACDMPFVSTLAPLVEATSPLAAARRGEFWEPFYSVHDPRIVRPFAERLAASGQRSLQRLFDAVPAVVVEVPPHELDDWDSPEDRS